MEASMNLFKLFKLESTPHADSGQLFDRISQLGAHLNESELKQITANAGLCGRIAYADTHITDDELEKIRGILLAESGLSENSVDIVMALIVEQRVELLTLEEHFYSRLANESMTREQKHHLLRNLFRIAAADGTICLEEENLLFNVAVQLKMSRQDIVDLKREFKNFLSVFQKQE
jgi:uncharacterized tellurite resistance protein B-like protein